MLTGSIRPVLFACLLILPACSRDKESADIQRGRAALPPAEPTPALTPVPPKPAPPRATTTPAVAATTQPRVARPTPVSETTAAKHLASMGFVPASPVAPQLVMADPKELERDGNTPLLLMGFHLKGSTIVAKHQPDGAPTQLKPQALSDEQAVIPPSELRKLKAGTYTFTVTGANGQTGNLPFGVSIE